MGYCFSSVSDRAPVAPAARRSTIAPTTNVAHVNNVTHQMQVDSEALQTPEIAASVSRPASHHLEAYGIPRSQEVAVVTQVFSPYITSSDEQQQAQAAGPELHTHARNPSNESASLPQSHDYETVQGILPRQVQQASSPAYQPPSGSTTTSDGGRTTPLRIGIAFGTLPNISLSSEGSTSTSSTNLFAAKTEKADGKAVGGGNSPNGNKKSSDKSLRFGFGNR